jgi:hypothetical protein
MLLYYQRAPDFGGIMKSTFFFLSFLFAVSTFASTPSAKRLPGESFEDALARVEQSRVDRLDIVAERDRSASSEAKRATSVAEVDLSQVTTLSAFNEVQRAFKRIRDHQILEDPRHPDFLRRPSWLYPDDGCFARAGIMNIELEALGYGRFKKVFIFGSLDVQTQNHPAGSVQWWYHVAPIVMAGTTAYVIDPAIEPQRPLSLEEWVLRQVGVFSDAKLAICHSQTYQPFSSCVNGSTSSDSEAKIEQRVYLDYEWERLEDLQRDPWKELNSSPPWLAPVRP